MVGLHAVLGRIRTCRVLPVKLLLPGYHARSAVRPCAVSVHGGRPLDGWDRATMRSWLVLIRLLSLSRAASAGTPDRACCRRGNQLRGRLLLLLPSRLLMTLPICVRRPGLYVVSRRLRRTVHRRGLLLLLLMTAADVDSGRPERHGQLGTASRLRGLMLLRLLLAGHVVAIRHWLGRRLRLRALTVLLLLILLLSLHLVVLLMLHMLPLLRMLRVARLRRQRLAAAHPLGLLRRMLRGLLRPIRNSHRLCRQWGRRRLLVCVQGALRDRSVCGRRRGRLIRLPVRCRCLRICAADGAVGQGDRLRPARLAVGCLRVTQQHALKHIVAGLLSNRSVAGARRSPVSRPSPHESDGHDRRSPCVRATTPAARGRTPAVGPRRAAARGPRLAMVVLVVVVVVVACGAALALVTACRGSVAADPTRPEAVSERLLLSVLGRRRAGAALEWRAAPAARRGTRGSAAAAPLPGAAGVSAALHEAAVAGLALLRRAVELLPGKWPQLLAACLNELQLW